jgi:putative transposase
MKASRFSDAQKAFILKQGSDGMPVADICRKAGISQATYFNWKKKYDGLLPTEMRRLKQLEDENSKLRKVVADLSLDKEMLQDAPPKALRPVRKRKLVDEMRGLRRDGVYRSGGRAVSSWSIRPPTTTSLVAPDRPSSNNGSEEICQTRVRYGYRRVHVLLRREGALPRPEQDAAHLSRVRPAIAQQNAQASRQGQAAGRSPASDAIERDVGDGLRA